MTRTVKCKKLGIEAPGLDEPPFNNELGQLIYDNISERAWQAWLEHQTMLINEYRLNLTDPQSKTFLFAEMEKFLFSGGSAKPPGYTEDE